MKRVLILLCVLALASMMLPGCGGSDDGAEAPDGGEPIIIGAALCQTGIQAPLDEPALRGAQLAVDELNANGGILGRPVELVAMDGKSDPVTVGNVTKQMIDQGAVAIIAPSDFDFGGPASREAQNAGMVGISPCASSPLYGSAALGDKQFTMSMWNTTMGAVAAEYAYNEMGYRTCYVITDDFIDYTKSLSRYFIIHFEDLGGEVFFEDTYTQGQADVSAQLARIKALPEQPDFIYISSYMPDLALMIRTLRESGSTSRWSAATRTTIRGCSRHSVPSTAARSTSIRTASCRMRRIRTTPRSLLRTRRSSVPSPTPCGSCPATTS
jgi:branched-chain amino acid transport system substrate-binding protein